MVIESFKEINLCFDINSKETTDFFDLCTKCKCCERHQINRPSKLEKYIERPLNEPKNYNCKCPCRHNARFLCRMITMKSPHYITKFKHPL